MIKIKIRMATPTAKELLKNKFQITGIVLGGLLFGGGLYVSYKHHQINSFIPEFEEITKDK